MHHQTNARGQLVEITDLRACSSCGQRFERRLFTLSWANCQCRPGIRGHRIAICLRGTCRAETFDPPCVRTAEHHPLGGHNHWDTVQHGPVLDLG